MPSSVPVEHEPFELEVASDIRMQWLEGRIAALERHIEYQIDLLDEAAAKARRCEEQVRRYEEFMQTKTMRVLQRPRAVYSWLRRARRRGSV